MKESNLEFYRPSIDFILDTQLSSGAIPWERDGKIDPWDHIEAAMGLAVAGELEASEKAYFWLKNFQLNDGSWYAEYSSLGKTSLRKESNFVAYIATGLWHYYLISKDIRVLRDFEDCLDLAFHFVLDMQSSEGDISWAIDEEGRVLDDALITGCSSIYKSLECYIAIKTVLGSNCNKAKLSMQKLKDSLINKPERYDRKWNSKDRYSMDWYYPILCNVIKGNEAEKRIDKRLEEFVVRDLGCKCVKEEPWVTVAESSELVISLVNIGLKDKAKEIFNWLHQHRDTKEGLYWTGYVFQDDTFWPVEKPTWTAAAVLLAADSLYNFSEGNRLFLTDWS
tara:strand:+ start:30706 stop:31716 length:1011 start_codon:yes stop_codon:yes gene_type:complete